MRRLLPILALAACSSSTASSDPALTEISASDTAIVRAFDRVHCDLRYERAQLRYFIAQDSTFAARYDTFGASDIFAALDQRAIYMRASRSTWPDEWFNAVWELLCR